MTKMDEILGRLEQRKNEGTDKVGGADVDMLMRYIKSQKEYEAIVPNMNDRKAIQCAEAVMDALSTIALQFDERQMFMFMNILGKASGTFLDISPAAGIAFATVATSALQIYSEAQNTPNSFVQTLRSSLKAAMEDSKQAEMKKTGTDN